MKKYVVILFAVAFVFSIDTFAEKNNISSFSEQNILLKDTIKKTNSYKVTFIELGSVRCIPCQKMQPVMKSIEEKYGTQVKVVFYDVWTAEGKPYAAEYKINLIPTQVFLDKNGKEFFRHEGFFPEEEIVKIFNQQGVK